jgi:hypothetical protein
MPDTQNVNKQKLQRPDVLAKWVGALQLSKRGLEVTMRNRIKHIAAALGLAAVLAGGHAAAVPVTVAGATVSFTFDSALSGLFGTPAISGDVLYFTPTAFKTQSLNGSGFTTASQTFNVAVHANSGFELSAVNYTEDGDYYKIGSGSSVAVGGKLYVRDLDAPLAPALSGKLKPAQALTVTASLLDFEPTDWAAQAGVVVPTTWGGADGVVGGVNVTLENLLLASTLSGNSAAFIEKKFAALSVSTLPLIVASPVPEPDAWMLFVSGLGIVAYAFRRRHLRA